MRPRAGCTVLGALLFTCVACSSDPDPAAAPAPVTPPAANPCADGFALDADGACVDVPAPASCPGGTRPRVGSSSCEPVGWVAACPAGTTRDVSGFGCADVAPPAPCTGATREAVGAPACVPVGDCTGAFPPAGAIVVDASLADAQVDATHVKTLAAGVAAAGDGATIAIAIGTYEEAVTIEKRVTVVGRCAAKVEIKSPAGSVKAGIEVLATGVIVRGVTLTGHVDGVAVKSSGEATIEDVVVRDSRYAGLYVEGGRATIRRTKVEDTVPQADARGGFDLAVGVGAEATMTDGTLSGGVQAVLAGADSKVTLTRVVVTRQAPNPSSNVRATGVVAIGGAHLTVAQSILRDMTTDSAAAAEDDGVVELTETIVRDVHIGGSAARGYGVTATYGGHVVLRSSMIANVANTAALSRDDKSTLELSSVAIVAPAPVGNPVGAGTSDGKGGGIAVSGKGKATLDNTVILGAWGVAAFADAGGFLELKRSLLDATRGTSGADPTRSTAVGFVVLNGASATVADVSITRTSGAGVSLGKGSKLNGDHLLVRGVAEGQTDGAGEGIGVGPGSALDLEASVIDGATTSGLLIQEGSATLVRFVRSSVHGTKMARSGFGHGVTLGVGARLVLSGTSLVDNPGIGLAVDGGKALVDAVTIARNGVGVHAQNGSFLVERDDADADTLGDGEVRVATTTRFSSNAARVGSGIVPLPSPVLF